MLPTKTGELILNSSKPNPPVNNHLHRTASVEGLAALLADLKRAIETKDLPMSHRLVCQAQNMHNELIGQEAPK